MDTVDIREQLDAELADAASPPIGSLVTDAVATGKRMRRRRRFVAAVGICAGVVVLVAGGLAGAAALRPAATDPVLRPAAAPTDVAPSPTDEPTPVSTPDPAEAKIINQLTSVLPAGATIHDPKVTTDDYGTTVTFTLANGGASGQVVLGVLIGSDDPARYLCHTQDGDCQVGSGGAAETVRSMYLPGGELRVDALLGSSENVRTVFVEADPDALTREQGIIIATSATWLE